MSLGINVYSEHVRGERGERKTEKEREKRERGKRERERTVHLQLFQKRKVVPSLRVCQLSPKSSLKHQI